MEGGSVSVPSTPPAHTPTRPLLASRGDVGGKASDEENPGTGAGVGLAGMGVVLLTCRGV